jgi:hypothetical protein
MQTELIVSAVVVVVWIITLTVLYQSGHDGWGYMFLVIPLGTVLGSQRANELKANRISVVGVHGPSGLECPNCASTEFAAHRTIGGIFLLSFLAPKTRVRCESCGKRFTRG